MSGGEGFAPYMPRAKKIEPKPRQPLWALTRNGDDLRAEIMFNEPGAGCELQIFGRGDHFLAGYHATNRDGAVAIAATIRADYEREGWTAPE